MTIQLGQRVTASHFLVRRSTYGTGVTKRAWEPRRGPVDGIYIGFRTYADGEIRGGIDEGTYFVAKRHIKVALIVPNERAKPIPVLFVDMEVYNVV